MLASRAAATSHVNFYALKDIHFLKQKLIRFPLRKFTIYLLRTFMWLKGRNLILLASASGRTLPTYCCPSCRFSILSVIQCLRCKSAFLYHLTSISCLPSVSSGDSVLIGVEDDPEFSSSSRSGQKRPAPSAPLQTNPAYQQDLDDPDDIHELQDHHEDEVHASPAVFDENSRHNMPSFDPDDDEDIGGGSSPFGGAGGMTGNPLFQEEGAGMTQNPLFGAGEGSTQNPLFGAEMSTEGDLGGF